MPTRISSPRRRPPTPGATATDKPTKKLPAYYFHRPGKKRPQDQFQRQDAEAVRAKSRARYHRDPDRAKAISEAYRKTHPERHREYVRASWRRSHARRRARRAFLAIH